LNTKKNITKCLQEWKKEKEGLTVEVLDVLLFIAKAKDDLVSQFLIESTLSILEEDHLAVPINPQIAQSKSDVPKVEKKEATAQRGEKPEPAKLKDQVTVPTVQQKESKAKPPQSDPKPAPKIDKIEQLLNKETPEEPKKSLKLSKKEKAQEKPKNQNVPEKNVQQGPQKQIIGSQTFGGNALAGGPGPQGGQPEGPSPYAPSGLGRGRDVPSEKMEQKQAIPKQKPVPENQAKTDMPKGKILEKPDLSKGKAPALNPFDESSEEEPEGQEESGDDEELSGKGQSQGSENFMKEDTKKFLELHEDIVRMYNLNRKKKRKLVHYLDSVVPSKKLLQDYLNKEYLKKAETEEEREKTKKKLKKWEEKKRERKKEPREKEKGGESNNKLFATVIKPGQVAHSETDSKSGFIRLQELAPKLEFYFIAKEGESMERSFEYLVTQEAVGVDFLCSSGPEAELGFVVIVGEAVGFMYQVAKLGARFDEFLLRLVQDARVRKLGYNLSNDWSLVKQRLNRAQAPANFQSVDERLFVSKTSYLLNLSKICLRVLGKGIDSRVKKLQTLLELQDESAITLSILTAYIPLVIMKKIDKLSAYPSNAERTKALGISRATTFVLDVTCQIVADIFQREGLKWKQLKEATYEGSPS
jgi:hypothetical protein